MALLAASVPLDWRRLVISIVRESIPEPPKLGVARVVGQGLVNDLREVEHLISIGRYRLSTQLTEQPGYMSGPDLQHPFSWLYLAQHDLEFCVSVTTKE
jgi:hypothetical protein